MSRKTHPPLGETALTLANTPRVSHVLGAFERIAGYKADDDELTGLYEAKGGPFAKPGSLDLQEHDLLHYLLGVNLVPVGNKWRKDNEAFVTGFTYGACPKFKDEDLDWWKATVKEKYPSSAQYKKRGMKCLNEGFELGRVWHKNTGLELEPLLQQAVAQDMELAKLHGVFVAHNMNLNNYIGAVVKGNLNQSRHGTPESFNVQQHLSAQFPEELFRNNMAWVYGAKASGSVPLSIPRNQKLSEFAEGIPTSLQTRPKRLTRVEKEFYHHT
jgi:hypothetical protein